MDDAYVRLGVRADHRLVEETVRTALTGRGYACVTVRAPEAAGAHAGLLVSDLDTDPRLRASGRARGRAPRRGCRSAAAGAR